MPAHYSAEELRSASNRVMRSLSNSNSNSTRSVLTKPAIRNSIGLAVGKLSKSSRKRHNRKARTNLAGKSMENLLEELPQALKLEPTPVSVEQLEEQRNERANNRAHHSRKAEQKLIIQEIVNFAPTTLDEVKARLQKLKQASAETK